jgi:predicted ABC-type ATPase
MPNVVVIAGANGAGKSTLAPYLLRDTVGILEYVNADTIAAGLSAFAPEDSAFEAGKVMLARLNELAAQKRDFAFETTLAGRFYINWLKKRKSEDYQFHLVFLYLRSAELGVERVKARIKLGGHSIPEAIIRRRYVKGLQNFFRLYQPIADSWRFYDASEMPLLIASGAKDSKINVVEAELWNDLQKSNR